MNTFIAGNIWLDMHFPAVFSRITLLLKNLTFAVDWHIYWQDARSRWKTIIFNLKKLKSFEGSVLYDSVSMSWRLPLTRVFFSDRKRKHWLSHFADSMTVPMSTESVGRHLKVTSLSQVMFLLLLVLSSQPAASNNTSQCFGVVCKGLREYLSRPGLFFLKCFREVPFYQLCIILQHCSKRLWPPPPFPLNI